MIGLTYAEIISTLVLTGALIAAYVTIQVRIAKTEAWIMDIRKDLDRHRDENREDFRQAYEDNKSEFRSIHEKLDKILQQ